MITRRKLVIALGAGTVPLPPTAFAQQASKIPLIGLVHPGFSALAISVATLTMLREGLSAAGYVDGKTIRIESRWGNGKPDALPGLVRELIQMRVDVLVTVGPSALTAARAATSSIPIVAHDLETDPVAAKLAASLARPPATFAAIWLTGPHG